MSDRTKLCWRTVGLAAVLAVVAVPALCARQGKDPGAGDFAIYVAPAVIVKSAPLPWITIHTEVELAAVDDVGVAIDGTDVDPSLIYSDSRGNLVVKLRFAEVADLLSAPEATFALALIVDGELLSAAATVPVHD